ncbi:MAG: two-component regulator propeller domain-containing protein [Bacteroidota bacterium]
MRLHRSVLGWLACAAVWSMASVVVSAQTRTFDHLGTAEGLPSAAVYDMLQDRQGFVWFATGAGIARYDGYAFTTFQHNPRDTTSLPSNWAWTLFEDQDGTLWVGTYGGGLSRFDRRTGTFTTFFHDLDDPASLSADVVTAITQDHKGDIWIGTESDGVNRLESATGQFTRYRHTASDTTSLSSDHIHAITVDQRGTVWIGTQGGGISRYVPADHTFERYTQQARQASRRLNWNGATVLTEGHDGTLWAGMWDGRVQGISTDTQTLLREYRWIAPDAIVKVIHEDARRRLWIGTWAHGVYVVDRQTEEVTHYEYDPADPLSLSNNNVTAIMEDHTGVVWVTTRDGVNRLAPQSTRFAHHSQRSRSRGTLAGQQVYAMLPSRAGGLWIGSDRGVDHYDPVQDAYDPIYASRGHVRSLAETEEGVLWVGTDSRGLHAIDIATGATQTFVSDRRRPGGLTNDGVMAIHRGQGAPHTLWLGTWVGLNRRDGVDGAIQNFRTYAAQSSAWAQVAHEPILTVYERPSMAGVLWLGTNEGGLVRLDPNREAIRRYHADRQQPSSLSGNQVRALYEDASGALWVGTGSGLNVLDEADAGRFTVYTIDDGLPSNDVRCIVPDADGALWLGTNAGLAKFDRRTRTATAFGAGDGLRIGEVVGNACARLADGRLAFGGSSGFQVFHTDSLRQQTIPPRIALTDMHVLGQAAQVQEDGSVLLGEGISGGLAERSHVRLTHEQHVFSVGYTGLHFANPDRNRYRYQLEGVQDAWVEVGAERRVAFAGLSPGTYTFRVQAANRASAWSPSDELVVSILPPWWQTAWAYGLYAGLLVALMLWYGRWRSYRVRRQNRVLAQQVRARTAEVIAQNEQLTAQAAQLQQLDKAKTRFFANLSHEFRTPLTLIQDPIRHALNGGYGRLDPLLNDHLAITHRNAGRLRRLIDQLLKLTRLDAGHLRLEASRQDLVAFTRRVVGHFASVSQRRLIELVVAPERDTVPIYVDAEKLEHVLTNLLSNAFKFTSEGGRVVVAVTADATTATVAVRDTGCGIAPEDLPHLFDRFYQVADGQAQPYEGTGIGLALVKELVEAHHGTVTVTSDVGKGSNFGITLPLGRAHLRPDEILEPSIRPLGDGVQVPMQDVAVQVADYPHPNGEAERPTVLLVEDNEDLRTYLRERLAEHYDVVEAANGAEGFRKACEVDPALIISDVMMPEINGLDLLRRLKAHETLQTVPVLMLTARNEERDRLAGFEAQAEAYVAKPFHMPELQARMAALLDTRRRLQEVYGQQVVRLTPDQVALKPEDAQFLAQVQSTIEAHIGEATFNVEALAAAMHVSKRQLYRRLQALTSESPAALVRRMRLERAQQLIASGSHSTVAEVAYAVGFNDAKHFSQLYRQQFGHAPSAL